MGLRAFGSAALGGATRFFQGARGVATKSFGAVKTRAAAIKAGAAARFPKTAAHLSTHGRKYKAAAAVGSIAGAYGLGRRRGRKGKR